MRCNDGSNNSGQDGPTIIAPYQVEETADYRVEVKIKVIGGCGCFDFATIRGTTIGGIWTGYKGTVINNKQIAVSRDTDEMSKNDFQPGAVVHTYAIEAKGANIEVFVDGVLILQAHDDRYLAGGQVGIKSYLTQLAVTSFKVIAV